MLNTVEGLAQMLRHDLRLCDLQAALDPGNPSEEWFYGRQDRVCRDFLLDK